MKFHRRKRRGNNFAHEMKTFSLNITPLGSAPLKGFLLLSRNILSLSFSVKFANNDDVAIFKLYF